MIPIFHADNLMFCLEFFSTNKYLYCTTTPEMVFSRGNGFLQSNPNKGHCLCINTITVCWHQMLQLFFSPTCEGTSSTSHLFQPPPPNPLRCLSANLFRWSCFFASASLKWEIHLRHICKTSNTSVHLRNKRPHCDEDEINYQLNPKRAHEARLFI